MLFYAKNSCILAWLLSFALGEVVHGSQNEAGINDPQKEVDTPPGCLNGNSAGLNCYRKDCTIPLTLNEIQVLNNVVAGFLHIFTGETSPFTANEPDRKDSDWLSREAALDCMGMLTLLKDSLYSVVRYLWLAASCKFTNPEDFKQALDQAKEDFKVAMDILPRVDAHSSEESASIMSYYQSKVGHLERIVKEAIATTELTYHAKQCHAPNVWQVATALEKSREELVAQKNLMERTVRELREEVKKTIAENAAKLERLESDTRRKFSEQEEHNADMTTGVATLTTNFGVDELGMKVVRKVEKILDDYSNIVSGSDTRLIQGILRKTVLDWHRRKQCTNLARIEPGKIPSCELSDISGKFIAKSEELVLVLADMNAHASGQAPNEFYSAWLAFQERFFNPLLVKLVSGHWFTVESKANPDEHLCYRSYNTNTDPPLFLGAVKNASEDLSSCTWKLTPGSGAESGSWLYLQNKLNSSNEGEYREQVKIRILELPNVFITSHDEKVNNSSVGSFVIAILSKTGDAGGENVIASATSTSEVNENGTRVFFAQEDQILVLQELQWEVRFETYMSSAE